MYMIYSILLCLYLNSSILNKLQMYDFLLRKNWQICFRIFIAFKKFDKTKVNHFNSQLTFACLRLSEDLHWVPIFNLVSSCLRSSLVSPSHPLSENGIVSNRNSKCSNWDLSFRCWHFGFSFRKWGSEVKCINVQPNKTQWSCLILNKAPRSIYIQRRHVAIFLCSGTELRAN